MCRRWPRVPPDGGGKLQEEPGSGTSLCRQMKQTRTRENIDVENGVYKGRNEKSSGEGGEGSEKVDLVNRAVEKLRSC